MTTASDSQYTVIDDDDVEGTEEFTITWMGVEPHVEPGVKSATFTLTILDNERMWTN